MKTIQFDETKYKLVPIIPTGEMVDAALAFHEGEHFLPYSLYSSMLNAAPAAEEAPQQEPNWKHPKIQSLIGADARNRIVIDLIWQILEQPEREDFTAADMEYWDSIHDAVKAAITKQQPATHGEPVTWRNAAIRVGEDLCSVGPFGYYDMTAEQWLDWALTVVTIHPSLQPTSAHIKAMQQALEALKMCRAVIHNNIQQGNAVGSPNPFFSADVDSALTALQNALKGTT